MYPTIHITRDTSSSPTDAKPTSSAAPIWPLNCSKGLYENHQSRCGSSTSTVDSHFYVPGRLVDRGPHLLRHPSEPVNDHKAYTGTWVHHQCREVFSSSILMPIISRSIPQLDDRESLPHYGTLPHPKGIHSNLPFFINAPSQSLAPPTRTDAITKPVPVNSFIHPISKGGFFIKTFPAAQHFLNPLHQ